jgi:hypothetical protein
MTDLQDSTPAQVQALEELKQLPLDREMVSALQDPSHVGHAAATRRRRELYDAAFGDGVRDTSLGSAETQSPEQQFLEPPRDPTEYRFDPVPGGLTHDAKLESKARNWFHQAGVPHWLARNIVREWNRSLEKPPTAQQNEDNAATTELGLRQSWGENYNAKIASARSLIASLNDSDIADLLDRSGLTNSEYLIRQIVALAERQSAGQKA